MPRGIPNARRDETGMKFTTFHIPLAFVHFNMLNEDRLILEMVL